MVQQPSEELIAAVLRLIQPRTKLNPICRGDLLWRLARDGINTTDRMIRKAIETLRPTEEGHMICASMKSPGGYYMAADEDELVDAVAPDRSRSLSTLWRLNKQLHFCNLEAHPQLKAEIESQREMFESVGSQLVLMAQGHVDPVTYLKPDGKRK